MSEFSVGDVVTVRAGSEMGWRWDGYQAKVYQIDPEDCGEGLWVMPLSSRPDGYGFSKFFMHLSAVVRDVSTLAGYSDEDLLGEIARRLSNA